MPEVVSIVYKPAGAGPDPLDRYVREPVAEAVLVEGLGIRGDQKGVSNRQLNVMSAETLEALRQAGFNTTPGQMGEQVVIRGLDVAALAPGTRLRIGERACIEIVKPRTGCDRFEAVQRKPAGAAVGGLGAIARVVAGGPIRLGDAVSEFVIADF